ncbi:AAA family ATPase [Terasakiella sp.]|uniref:AAA family ATPase n=1 Tax=Terasakiella sp. TaxID=2034861 RepID=UPI003AA95E05
MSVIEIRKATRAGARLVIGLPGISGSGKTYTALQFAWGLANYQSEKVGLLDAENRRGSLYADILKDSAGKVHPFMIGDLIAPFSPARYVEAIHAFQKAGVEVLVIDSATHEWEGQGGCHDIADANKRMPDWKNAKAEHKKFMNALLQSDMHIIACIRAREKVEVAKDATGKTIFKPLGIMPVQEQNFMFEMTASLMMWNEGKNQAVEKCPEALRPFLGREEGYITPADGKAVRDWVDGGGQVDETAERYRHRLQSISEKGADFAREAWNKTPPEIQKSLGEGFFTQLIAAAKGHDEARSIDHADNDNLDNLNSELAGGRK